MSDYTSWPLARLISQRKHLGSVLVAGAGQGDPTRPQLRAEYQAIDAEIRRREGITAR